jgi:MFS family permease
MENHILALLGFFEAGTYPSLILIFNTMYRKSEQSTYYGYLYLSNGVATIIGVAATVGVTGMRTTYGIHPWQW